MQRRTFQIKLAGIALAATALLAACGGGSATSPGKQSQTITFTSPGEQRLGSTPGALSASSSASLPVTITTKTAAVCTVSGTSLTLVTPGTCTLEANQAGNDAYSAGTAQTVSFNVTQSGATSTCTTSTTQQCYNFSETGLSIAPFGADMASTIANDPSDNTNKTAKYVYTAATDGWGGGTLSTSGTANTVVPVNLTTSKIVTLRSYAPAAGKAILLKFENSADPGRNFQIAVNTTKANTWETLSFDFTTPSSGTYDSTVTYDRVSIFPAFTANATKDAAATYYFDELKYPIGSTSSGASTLSFSTGFASAAATIEGGLVSGNGGSDLDGWNCNGTPAWCGNGSGGSGASSYYYSYYQTPSVPSGMYSGVDIYAPAVTSLSSTVNTSGIQISNQTKINFTFNPNAEWFNSATKNFAVDLTLGKIFTVAGAACHQQLRAIVTPTSASATAYSVNLSSFTVVQDCAAATSVTAALSNSPISMVSIKGAGGVAKLSAGGKDSGGNMSVIANGVYPTTVALTGGITFN